MSNYLLLSVTLDSEAIPIKNQPTIHFTIALDNILLSTALHLRMIAGNYNGIVKQQIYTQAQKILTTQTRVTSHMIASITQQSTDEVVFPLCINVRIGDTANYSCNPCHVEDGGNVQILTK